jgi:hypothetical protein
MLLALAVSAPLAAQQPDSMKPPMGMHPMMGDMMMTHMMDMMGPMMRTMAFTPDHLLGRKDALDLTPQQVTRLTALRDGAKTAHDAAQAEMQAHMTELARAMSAAAPDTTAVRQHFQAAHAAMGRAHWAMLVAAAQARALLTDAQRGRVDGWADMMEMHEHARDGHPGMPGREEHHPSRH